MYTLKHIVAFATLFLISCTVLAQEKPEIKGNRNLQKATNNIYATFQVVEIDDELEVVVRQGTQNSYTLEADENLFGIIRFVVQNNVLKIYTTHEITRSRKIDIELTVNNLQKVVLKNDAEIKSKDELTSEMFEVYADNSCEVDLEVKTKTFKAIMRDNATGSFKVHSETAEITMNGRTDVNADIETDGLTITTKENAEIKLDGDADTGQFTLMDSSKIDAERAKISDVNVVANDNTDSYIHATNNLVITAKGDSKIYVYGNPDIAIETFADKAEIIKK